MTEPAPKIAEMLRNAPEIGEFCTRWKIERLELFGSALRADFGPASDIDILVTFAAGSDWSLLDHVRMEDELSGIVGRTVDLVSRRAVARSHNWIRRDAILNSAEPIYAAR
jgi:hypothetical protein